MPAVQIECLTASRELRHADRVKPAGNRFAEIAFPCEEAPFDGAEAIAILIEMSVGTFLHSRSTGNHRRHDVAFHVYVKKSFLGHHVAALLLHQRGINRIVSLKGLYLRLIHGSSAVAIDAAATLAFLVVAGKIFGDDIL